MELMRPLKYKAVLVCLCHLLREMRLLSTGHNNGEIVSIVNSVLGH